MVLLGLIRGVNKHEAWIVLKLRLSITAAVQPLSDLTIKCLLFTCVINAVSYSVVIYGSVFEPSTELQPADTDSL